MNPPDKPCQATPAGDLRQQIIDSRVPKNEREWWASREIEKLERELAAAKAECERLTANQRQPAEDIFVSHLCDEITRLRAEVERLTVACNKSTTPKLHEVSGKTSPIKLRLNSSTYASKSARAWLAELDAAVAERDSLRAEVERWKTVAAQMTAEREHNANEAGRLRAEVERLTAKIGNQADRIRYLEGATNHATGTPLSQAIARAEKAEAELAEAKVERETIAQSSLRSLEAYIDKLKQFAERAERAEAEIAEWSVLNLWGGTPDFIHEFIKGQQARIHRCQDLEADNAKWQKLLLMSRDDREIDLISEIEEQARLLGMSGEREADLSGKLGRLESELAAIKNGHGELGKYEQLRLKNAELQRDKARLDWLEKNWIHWPITQNEETIREAIDAAMKGTP
jgi:DNA repair exonuclease SbcCD ATPase subunit